MPRLIRPLLALCALCTAACYEYLPARSATSLVGRRVQLSLTDSGAVVLASRIGPSVDAIEGDLLADSAGAYLVGVALTRARSGAETDWRGERLAVAHSLVASFAERRFSRSRSTFAGAHRGRHGGPARRWRRHGRRCPHPRAANGAVDRSAGGVQPRTSTLLRLKSDSIVQMNSMP
jgi:hypothetical protein